MDKLPEQSRRGKRAIRTLALIALLAIGLATCLVRTAEHVGRDLSGLGWRSGWRSYDDVDFSKYIIVKTLHSRELDFDRDDRRVIFIGDVHGRYDDLQNLLQKLRYSNASDLLVHTGDFLSKATLDSAQDVISFFSRDSVLGVRGNHDQKIVEWRAWMEWIRSHKGGKKWLEEMERMYEGGIGFEESSQAPLDSRPFLTSPRDWMRIPDDWDTEFMGEHYQIARSLTATQYEYLLSLPLVLHIPHLHTYVVHAGVLPHDPRFPFYAPHQPLARLPVIDDNDGDNDEFEDEERNVTALRLVQEKAVLDDVPQNSDNPWVVLNMRGVLEDGTITRKNSKGQPWSEIWNSIMELCDGYDDFWEDQRIIQADHDDRVDKLPCYASTVIYGHAATRGLDIKKWSKGLDSGCTYGRHLTSLVLSAPNASVPAVDGDAIEFGAEDSNIEAKIVQNRSTLQRGSIMGGSSCIHHRERIAELSSLKRSSSRTTALHDALERFRQGSIVHEIYTRMEIGCVKDMMSSQRPSSRAAFEAASRRLAPFGLGSDTVTRGEAPGLIAVNLPFDRLRAR
ncbi:Metallo-dependent phosphatase [Schizopora paradoxa]|uniref:Metallo-dependent phosphatase n=1 Tax=Schizopora paradoxa TaxID=27342 RepID=A0A0H2RRX6_9AGAM|nr:Metallo-dependent phosphatase [Schizopora paradoxa]